MLCDAVNDNEIRRVRRTDMTGHHARRRPPAGALSRSVSAISRMVAAGRCEAAKCGAATPRALDRLSIVGPAKPSRTPLAAAINHAICASVFNVIAIIGKLAGHKTNINGSDCVADSRDKS